MDQALRVESRWFAKILRSPRSRRDDPLAVRLDAGPQQRRAAAGQCAGKAAEENRRARRRLHGRRHRLCQRARRDRGRADRSRSGDRREGQSAFAKADDRSGQSRPRHHRRPRRRAGAHQADRRFCRAEGLRSCHRSGVRGSQSQGRSDFADAERDRRQRDLRLQHLDAADHFACRSLQGPAPLHRHPFLLAGRAHDAGRDHHGQGNRRRGAGAGARFCARDPQDSDRRQRFARLLYLAGGRHLSPRRPSDADRRRAGGDDRECRPHGRHAGRPAGA